MVLPALDHSIMRRAVERGLVAFRAANPRDFAEDGHRTVDDSAYGGGPGMVMMVEPVAKAIRSLSREGARVVITDPTGERFEQRHAHELTGAGHVVFVCGHYEGIDDRVRQIFSASPLSIGDFVMTGGELAALAMADAVVRLMPGVVGEADSLRQDSHSDGLLSAPQYTRPAAFEGHIVPEVLLSGDHGAVERWRREHALRLTRANRPDLFCRAALSKPDLDLL
jgi:tRNA (guanine37-N1)-methyltransferase